MLLILPWPVGCNRLGPHPKADVVYVKGKPTFLRDRIAAVSNKVAPVAMGERLQVVERSRRFLKVKTEKNEVGWIEEHAVIGDDVYQKFVDLQKAHQKDSVVATAVLRDDLNLHLTPGRDTEYFYLLPEGTKLQLLQRTSVPKAPSILGSLPRPIATPRRVKAVAKSAKDQAAPAKPSTTAKPGTPATPAAVTQPQVPAAPVVLEDWWLLRDPQGHVGWMRARPLDVDVPDAIGAYSEGQKIVGAYVLATVEDSEASTPDKRVPEYVTVVNPYKDGLFYDFDQVRVFTWNVKKHRYETAYRQRNLQGFLPVTVEMRTFDNQGPVPSFSFRQAVHIVPPHLQSAHGRVAREQALKLRAAAKEQTAKDQAVLDQAALDASAGPEKPVQMETLTFRMDGVMVKRVGAPGQPVAPKAAPAAKTANPKIATRSSSRRAKPAKARRVPRKK